ncbi:CidA/LrgA family protein [Undibacterium sp. SXout11W]|uniref:CidA/LrgA family protein n=1 Tax=Undibacterium sp. SXout11W TaxID=3413050 RepID=UPI003BF43592
MIRTFSVLLIFQCLGEGLVYATGLPVPGPVIGMLFLFIYLVIRKSEAAKLVPGVQTLLGHLSLLFIPAGVGIMVHGKMVMEEWLPLSIALIVSTAVSIVVTAVCVKWLQK